MWIQQTSGHSWIIVTNYKQAPTSRAQREPITMHYVNPHTWRVDWATRIVIGAVGGCQGARSAARPGAATSYLRAARPECLIKNCEETTNRLYQQVGRTFNNSRGKTCISETLKRSSSTVSLGLSIAISTDSWQLVTKSSETVSLLAPHQGESGSIPGRATPGFSLVGIVPDNAAGQLVFSGISRFPRPFIPTLLHAHLTSPSSALKTRCQPYGLAALRLPNRRGRGITWAALNSEVLRADEDRREYPPTSGVVRHDSHVRKFGNDPAGNQTQFAYVGGEQSNRSATTAPQETECKGSSPLYKSARPLKWGHVIGLCLQAALHADIDPSFGGLPQRMPLQDYKNRDKRHDVLVEIAVSFGISKDEIERKIKNLLSHFARECKKENNTCKSGSGTGMCYRSKWFAYDAMLFLKDRNKQRRLRTQRTRVHLSRQETLPNVPNCGNLSDTKRYPSRRTYSLKKQERGEYTVFGEQVAIKLTKLLFPHDRYMVQHIINNTLFGAEMGKYNTILPLFTA
ncbi:hypothetical protein PR048_029103 [Dryococelus australis]|uniref:MADF domain-containing protein n=1 Tax=Dryococelus australis TaxID=614101 RepID=A0ABQ9GD11_9NEOP|nr:hypothetical protein PR048_029103 [Dryococelus australis]